LFQQRLQDDPDAIEHERLRGLGRVDAVGLEELRLVGEVFEQEGHQRGAMRAVARDPPGIRHYARFSDLGSPGSSHPEVTLLARPWGFDPGDIRVPCAVWHGSEDRLIPEHHGRHLAAVIPGCAATYHPRDGHFLPFQRGAEILRALVS